MSIIDEARAMRASYIALAQSAPDELLSSGDYLSVFDPLCGDGGLIPARSVRRHEGNLYRANADCWDREDNWPSAAPTSGRRSRRTNGPPGCGPPARMTLTTPATR
ncbi:MAG: hypothetical protein ACLTB5_13805 [Acutalibacteraceae bacterium]